MQKELNIKAIGGYGVIGRNMTAVQYGDEIVVIDLGLYLNRYISHQESGEPMTEVNLIDEEAIPNDREFFAKHGKKVKAIVLGHGHLDHIGAVRFLASKYNCPIVASPYTIELLKTMSKDDKWKLKNKLIPLNLNSSYKVSENLTVELVYVTHSILHSAITVVHTPAGAVVYTPDYKLDNSPTIGQKTNMQRLREIGRGKVAAMLIDCTRASMEGHSFSESVARDMLKDVLLGMNNKGQGIIVTTFSSNLARYKSVLDWADKLGREVIFVGRSLGRYIGAAERLGLVDFSKRAEIAANSRAARAALSKVNRNREKYILCVTGNQGEPNAMLIRMAKDETPFSILPGDFVIFSCDTIPEPMIQANRRVLEQLLHRKKARVFKGVHESGHAGKEDHRDMIKLLMPDHIIPAHGTMALMSATSELAVELGYSMGKNVHLMQEGQEFIVPAE